MRRATLALSSMLLAVPAPADDALTDEEFFEYLGSFDDGHGRWFDPMELDGVVDRLDVDRATDDDNDDAANDDDETVDDE